MDKIMKPFSTSLMWIFLIWIKPAHSIDVEIKPSCPASETVCRFNWTITQLESTMLYENGRGIPIVYRDGSFKKRLSCTTFENATEEELEKANMADGFQKFIYAINNQMPGPTIVVYENQEIEVTLTNGILHEGAGIHWHGLFNKGTPFMDGVPGVTQCNINPLETFVYKFKAEPFGTHWYHSHMGVQRSDGLFGGLIILSGNENDTLPEFTKDYLFMLHDWFPSGASPHLHAYTYGLELYMEYGFNATECEENLGSTCVNGRGYNYDGNIPLIPVPPVTYTVNEGGFYRFRFINTGATNPYKVHIDQHKMMVIASDGGPVIPFETDYVILHSGERYDVYIQANQPVDNYWIRVEYLYTEEQPGLAILRYDGAPNELPTSTKTPCTSADKCEVTNCPFSEFSNDALNLACISVGDMKSTGQYRYFDVPHKKLQSHNSKETDSEENFVLEEHFFVVESTEAVDGVSRPSVNAIHFMPPSLPPQISREADFDHDCEQYHCDSQPCQCTNVVKLNQGNVIQMVFASADNPYGHPMHLHGHDFQILKVVHGDSGIHPDIRCFSGQLDRCTNPFWTNASWAGGNVPGINIENPPEKDTVIVPTGGYVVVRYTANSPGWWVFHCHVDNHFATGMGVLIQEGEAADMPVPPTGFPTCGSFLFDQGFPVDKLEASGSDSTGQSQSTENWMYVVSCLGTFLAGFLLAMLVITTHKQFKRRKEQTCKVEDTQMNTVT